MRTLWRNRRRFWFLPYESVTEDVDEYGNVAGTHTVKYRKPVEAWGNISAATGYAQTEQFGNLDSYDRVIVTDDVNCPIDENSVLFVDGPPQFDRDGNPIYDYIVRRIARSLNSVSIAISKVRVSGYKA